MSGESVRIVWWWWGGVCDGRVECELEVFEYVNGGGSGR